MPLISSTTVYEKGLQNCLDLKTGAIFSTCPENCICGDKNISHLDYGGDNLSHSYNHVFGTILKQNMGI